MVLFVFKFFFFPHSISFLLCMFFLSLFSSFSNPIHYHLRAYVCLKLSTVRKRIIYPQYKHTPVHTLHSEFTQSRRVNHNHVRLKSITCFLSLLLFCSFSRLNSIFIIGSFSTLSQSRAKQCTHSVCSVGWQIFATHRSFFRVDVAV